MRGIHANPSDKFVTMEETFDITAVGLIAERIGVCVADVRQSADQLGIAPAATIDGRAYFHEGDVIRIEGHLASMMRDRLRG